MARDAPDWVRTVAVTVIVENEPVLPLPANEEAAGDTGKYSGTAQTYQEVVSWEISADKVGELKEILILSDDYAHTLVQITVAGVVWATDWTPQGSMPIIFEDLKLAAASEVKVEAESSDGTAIEVDVVIVGKEIG